MNHLAALGRSDAARRPWFFAGSRASSRTLLALVAGVVCAASMGCTSDIDRKLDALVLTDQARAAVGRLRFANLREGDEVAAGDVVLCGPGDSTTLAFSRVLMTDYLGIDAAFLLPELFEDRSEHEVFLAVPQMQLMRLGIPPGIASKVSHPSARAREVAGSPRRSSDLRDIAALFEDHEIFAYAPAPSAQPPGLPPTAEAGAPAILQPRRIGITPFPRMGPRSGVVIERVQPDGAAARAGLVSGDKIVAVDGQKISDIWELKRAFDQGRGPIAVVRVRRRGKESTELVEVTLNP